jgi:hypothetical protein
MLVRRLSPWRRAPLLRRFRLALQGACARGSRGLLHARDVQLRQVACLGVREQHYIYLVLHDLLILFHIQYPCAAFGFHVAQLHHVLLPHLRQRLAHKGHHHLNFFDLALKILRQLVGCFVRVVISIRVRNSRFPLTRQRSGNLLRRCCTSKRVIGRCCGLLQNWLWLVLQGLGSRNKPVQSALQGRIGLDIAFFS